MTPPTMNDHDFPADAPLEPGETRDPAAPPEASGEVSPPSGPTDDLGEPVAASAPVAAPPASGGGLGEWLFSSRALTEARAAVGTRDPARARRLLAARKAIAYGDRVLDPSAPPKEGAAPELALGLYRDALGWLLGARTPDAPLLPPAEALAALDEATIAELTDNLASPSDARALATWDVTAYASADETALNERARHAKRIAHAMLDKLSYEERAVARLQLRRTGRLFGVLLALGALAAAIVLVVTLVRKKPDLAKGRPWRASSSADTCHPEKRSCTGADTGIFFHTKEEDSPWVEIDLGKGTAFSRVDIVNRLDCCTDRAIPLVIEVSNDRTTWKEVAKRTETFRTWSPTFSKENARYVRARVTRKSLLHLETFSVR